MEQDRIFIITFDRGSGNCHDEEIRICRAKTEKDAEQIAKRHYEKYYSGGGNWRFTFWEAEWQSDDTAFVTSYES